MKYFLPLLLFLNLQMFSQTSTDRELLLDDIIAKTVAREALSQVKVDFWNIDFPTQAEALRQEYIDADTDLKLYRALLKTIALNKDSHLSLSTVSGGISYSDNKREIPIIFAPDFTTTPHQFFIFDKTDGFDFNTITNGSMIEKGDVLIAVNGMDFQTFYNDFQDYFTHSTLRNMDWEIAESLGRHFSFYPENLYPDNAQVEMSFRKPDNNEYTVTLSWADNYSFTDVDEYSIPSRYRIVLNTSVTGTNSGNFELYRNGNTLLLNWLDLEDGLTADLAAIHQYMVTNNLLDANIIFFAPFSSGGSGSQEILSILTPYPYKTTFGNVKHSDISDNLARQRSSRVEDWILRTFDTGAEFTTNEPFKLQYGDEFTDGVFHTITNESQRFSGNVVAIFSSMGGSNLDQMSAMMIQNGVAYSIGNPTGGYSNTWEWDETLRYESNNQSVIEYIWNIGHTLRPDGQVLEGNPVDVDEMISMSSTNFNNYFDDLITRAENHLANPPNQKPEFYLENLSLLKTSGNQDAQNQEFVMDIYANSLQENETTSELKIGIYLSDDNSWDPTDTSIDSFTTSLTGNQKISLQHTFNMALDNEFKFLLVRFDDDNLFDERSEYNNIRFIRISADSVDSTGGDGTGGDGTGGDGTGGDGTGDDSMGDQIDEVNGLVVYPNPADNVINVLRNSTEKITYIISDVTGKKLQSNDINTIEYTIDVNNLNKGMYFIYFENSNEVYKVIKK